MVRFFYIYRVVQLLKILIQAGLWLFCNKIHLKNKRLFKTKGPLLIIANHPNSHLKVALKCSIITLWISVLTSKVISFLFSVSG